MGGMARSVLFLEPELEPFQFGRVEEISPQSDLSKLVGHHDFVKGEVRRFVGVQNNSIRHIDGLDIRVVNTPVFSEISSLPRA